MNISLDTAAQKQKINDQLVSLLALEKQLTERLAQTRELMFKGKRKLSAIEQVEQLVQSEEEQAVIDIDMPSAVLMTPKPASNL